MAVDKPCSFGCGRWGRVTSDTCEVCASNQTRWKNERPAHRLRYRQRLALAHRRQETYAAEFGDPPDSKLPEIEILEPKGKGTGRRKAEIIHLNTRRNTKRRRA